MQAGDVILALRFSVDTCTSPESDLVEVKPHLRADPDLKNLPLRISVERNGVAKDVVAFRDDKGDAGVSCAGHDPNEERYGPVLAVPTEGGPMFNAGLRKGDVITAITVPMVEPYLDLIRAGSKQLLPWDCACRMTIFRSSG